jgi:outer membrane protein TolC
MYRSVFAPAVLIATLAIPGTVSCMTLDQAVEIALSGNPDLEGVLHDWEAATARKTEVTTLPDPTLEFAVGSSGPDLGGDLRTFAIGQAIPFPTKITTSRARAQDLELAASSRYDAARRTLIAEVKRVYLELAVIDEKIAIYEQDLLDTRLLEDSIRRRYEVGRATQHDLVKTQVEALLVEDRLETLRRDTRAGITQRLVTLLGSPPDLPTVVPVMPSIDFSQVDTLALRTVGVTEAPAVSMRTHQSEAARKDIGLARMAWIPDFKLRFFLDERDMAMGRNKAKGVMFSFNLPVWAWRNKARVDEKKASLARADSDLESARESLEGMLEKRVASFSTARASHALFRDEVIPQAELAYLSAATGYETGTIDILSVISAHRSLRDARVTRLDLWGKAARELAGIEEITGVGFY